jgi:hypothetical protein
VWKAKVCQLVVNCIHTLVDLSGDRRLIVDYQGMPIEWASGDNVPQPKTNHFDRLGESDVKFPLYLEPGMPFLADSVDGGTLVHPNRLHTLPLSNSQYFPDYVFVFDRLRRNRNAPNRARKSRWSAGTQDPRETHRTQISRREEAEARGKDRRQQAPARVRVRELQRYRRFADTSYQEHVRGEREMQGPYDSYLHLRGGAPWM